MEYVPGGELFRRMQILRRLEEKEAAFYAANIVLGLEYLHANLVVYRYETLSLKGLKTRKYIDWG